MTPAPIEIKQVSVRDQYEELDNTDKKPEPYAGYGFKQLQSLCKQRRLSAKGSRDVLVSRLCGADSQPPQVEWKVMGRTPATTFRGRSID